MARNEEKAMAMLNRWWTQKRELHKKVVERPKGIQRIQNITTLTECEKWRNSILKEINKKVTVIQNAGLGEQRIRELNDEINQLLREKNNWEHRILELGGPNYRQLTKKQQGLDFLELPGFGGYKYFGAAKDLPGVRELFQKEVPAPPKEDLVSVYKNLDMEYYLGKKIWNQDQMEKEEKEIEDQMKLEKIDQWVNQHKQYVISKLNTLEYDSFEEIIQVIDEFESQNNKKEQDKHKEEVGVDEEEQISELEKKKQQLIKMFVEKDNKEEPLQKKEESPEKGQEQTQQQSKDQKEPVDDNEMEQEEQKNDKPIDSDDENNLTLLNK